MVKLTFKPTNIAGAAQFDFEADPAITVGDLKQLISPQCAGLAPACIRLVCAGRVWQDASTLESYGAKEGSIVHCLNNPQAAPAIASTTELQPANPFMNMGMGMPPPAAGGQGESLQSMMAQSQQMMQQNPEFVQQMMQSPMVQQMLENPDVMRAMMQMNPQTRQLMEENPEVARMLEDPETLRQSARMIANPSLMREMQRNMDTAMGRLDAMPGGHAALARMHREVVDPLQNAMSGANGENAAGINTYGEDAQGHRNTAPLANPWGAPAPASQPAPTATPFPAAQQPATPAAGGYGGAAAPPVNPMLQMMQAQQGGGADPMANMMNSPGMQQMMNQMMQNPQMMQQAMQMNSQMFGQQGGAPGAPGTPGANPMNNMMQQMMQNPQMMQQAMQMSQQMFGQQGGAPGMFGQPPAAAPGTTTNPPAQPTATPDSTSTVTPPAAEPTTTTAPATTEAASPPATQPAMTPGAPPVNPFAQMMQQMMQNPQMMQNAMQMNPMFAQQGGMGQNPFMGNFAPPAAAPAQGGAMDEASLAAAASNPMVRARFASQLENLLAMGFSDEQKCLRALVQCDGNVDRALDRLFADN
jgi:ubiquilin